MTAAAERVFPNSEGRFETKCRDCGASFEIDGPRGFSVVVRQHLPFYCTACRRKRTVESDRATRTLKLYGEKDPAWKCLVCGEEFRGRKKKYCSKDCARAAIIRHATQEVKVDCVGCGKQFVSTYKGKRYCSSACARNARRIRSRARGVYQHKDAVIPALPQALKRESSAELLFDAWCCINGIPCFRSVIDVQPNLDRVVWNGEKYIGVQIKSTKTARPDICQCGETKLGGVDWFVVVDPSSGRMRIIDAEELETKGASVVLPTLVRMGG
jgi:hypothetical protein